MTQAQLTARVAAIRAEAGGIKSFDLVAAGTRAALPPFTAGSHIDVHLRGGTVRQYSLYNAPHDGGRYRIAVKREPLSRGGSRALHDDVREGDLLTIGAPRNSFALDASAAHHLLLAGGIGITPLLSMAQHLAARGGSFALHYFVGTAPGQTAFRDILGQPGLRERSHLHHGLAPAEVRARLAGILAGRAPGAHLYLCGPAPFMALVRDGAAGEWPERHIHMEHFAPPAAAPQAGAGFVVRLRSTGAAYPVRPGESIVQALARHRIRIETSCEQGLCGTCLTGVLAGTPDHRDTFLSEEERACGDRIVACVSGCAGGTLLLDL
ncbi:MULTISPECIES: PDR/VanB family oxidoreductase [Cupriavidus]